VFLVVDFTLPNTYFYVEWQKMAVFVQLLLNRHCAEIVWIRKLLKSEFWKNFSDTANFPELCLFFYFLFVP